jgi:hypothetical protein
VALLKVSGPGSTNQTRALDQSDLRFARYRALSNWMRFLMPKPFGIFLKRADIRHNNTV